MGLLTTLYQKRMILNVAHFFTHVVCPQTYPNLNDTKTAPPSRRGKLPVDRWLEEVNHGKARNMAPESVSSDQRGQESVSRELWDLSEKQAAAITTRTD